MSTRVKVFGILWVAASLSFLLLLAIGATVQRSERLAAERQFEREASAYEGFPVSADVGWDICLAVRQGEWDASTDKTSALAVELLCPDALPQTGPAEDYAARVPQGLTATRVIHATECYSDQAVIDSGAACLWSTSPMLIAGHNNMGWTWFDELMPGQTVVVRGTLAEGTYTAVEHRELWNSHDVQAWMYDADLLLQTCDDSGGPGLGFTVLERI